jgi:hypothetical protein
MDWISSFDNEDTSFTVVENKRKKNMKRKSNVSASRPITRSQKSKRIDSTNCALSPGKVSRTRSKPKKNPIEGVIWNIRGVGKKGFASCVKDLLYDYGLDFIGLQETIKKDYDRSFFRKLDPGDNYFWKWVPSVGRSGGVLRGVKNDSLEVNAFKAGRYMLHFVLWDKLEKVSWSP